MKNPQQAILQKIEFWKFFCIQGTLYCGTGFGPLFQGPTFEIHKEPFSKMQILQNAQNAIVPFSLGFFKGVVKADVSCALRKRGKNWCFARRPLLKNSRVVLRMPWTFSKSFSDQDGLE